MKIPIKVNTWAITDVSVTVTTVCNCTFCFLPGLRDSYNSRKTPIISVKASITITGL